MLQNRIEARNRWRLTAVTGINGASSVFKDFKTVLVLVKPGSFARAMDSIPTVRCLLPEQRGLNEMTVMAPTVHEVALCESNVITHPAYLIISNSMRKPVRIMTALTVMTAMNLASIGRIGPMRVRMTGLGNPPGRETAGGAGIPVAIKWRAGTVCAPSRQTSGSRVWV